MGIFLDDKKTYQRLIQVTDGNTGEVKGLYLLPVDVDIEKFEKEFSEEIDQNDFDETNLSGAVRVYAYDSIISSKL